MVERALARTFRNFSTLFMLVAVVAFPIHVFYAFTFRDVIAASDYHDAIEEGPDDRKIGDVGPPQLENARLVFWIVTIGELALVPLAARATRRVFLVDEAGGVPTATDAWSHAFSRQQQRTFRPGWAGPALVGTVFAVVAGVLIHGIGTSLTEFLGADWRWVGVGLTQVGARAVGAPFALGPLALVRAKEGTPSAPKLY